MKTVFGVIQLASCEHFLRQATKSKKKAPSHFGLKNTQEATASHLSKKKKKRATIDIFRHWPGPGSGEQQQRYGTVQNREVANDEDTLRGQRTLAAVGVDEGERPRLKEAVTVAKKTTRDQSSIQEAGVPNSSEDFADHRKSSPMWMAQHPHPESGQRPERVGCAPREVPAVGSGGEWRKWPAHRCWQSFSQATVQCGWRSTHIQKVASGQSGLDALHARCLLWAQEESGGNGQHTDAGNRSLRRLSNVDGAAPTSRKWPAARAGWMRSTRGAYCGLRRRVEEMASTQMLAIVLSGDCPMWMAQHPHPESGQRPERVGCAPREVPTVGSGGEWRKWPAHRCWQSFSQATVQCGWTQRPLHPESGQRPERVGCAPREVPTVGSGGEWRKWPAHRCWQSFSQATVQCGWRSTHIQKVASGQTGLDALHARCLLWAQGESGGNGQHTDAGNRSLRRLSNVDGAAPTSRKWPAARAGWMRSTRGAYCGLRGESGGNGQHTDAGNRSLRRLSNVDGAAPTSRKWPAARPGWMRSTRGAYCGLRERVEEMASTQMLAIVLSGDCPMWMAQHPHPESGQRPERVGCAPREVPTVGSGGEWRKWPAHRCWQSFSQATVQCGWRSTHIQKVASGQSGLDALHARCLLWAQGESGGNGQHTDAGNRSLRRLSQCGWRSTHIQKVASGQSGLDALHARCLLWAQEVCGGNGQHTDAGNRSLRRLCGEAKTLDPSEKKRKTGPICVLEALTKLAETATITQ